MQVICVALKDRSGMESGSLAGDTEEQRPFIIWWFPLVRDSCRLLTFIKSKNDNNTIDSFAE